MPDLLNMTAVVTDRATGPLGTIQKSLQGMARGGAHELRGLNQSIDLLGRNLRGVAIPALQGLGVTSLSLTGIIGGLSVAMRGFGKDAIQLSLFARETKLSIEGIESLKTVAETLGAGNVQ